MSSAGIDYAFSPHPPIGTMKAANVGFVCRYISQLPVNDTNGKNLIPSECAALLAAGLRVVVVVEEGAAMMLGGSASGKSAATHANSVVHALNMPTIPIYFAADWDATPAQQASINAFLDGAASVIGHGRTGIYGGYYPVSRAFTSGKVAYGWQTVAWSGGQWESRAQLRQGLTFTMGGASVDHDQANKADYGQWPRPAAPKPPAPPVDTHVHITQTGDTLGAIASSRSMKTLNWLDLQQRLDAAGAEKLASDAVAKPGSVWRTV